MRRGSIISARVTGPKLIGTKEKTMVNATITAMKAIFFVLSGDILFIPALFSHFALLNDIIYKTNKKVKD